MPGKHRSCFCRSTCCFLLSFGSSFCVQHLLSVLATKFALWNAKATLKVSCFSLWCITYYIPYKQRNRVVCILFFSDTEKLHPGQVTSLPQGWFTNKQPHTLTIITMGNSKPPVTPICMSLDCYWVDITFTFSYIQKSQLKKDICHLLYMIPTDRKAAWMN